jgi:hypothetical protein
MFIRGLVSTMVLVVKNEDEQKTGPKIEFLKPNLNFVPKIPIISRNMPDFIPDL